MANLAQVGDPPIEILLKRSARAKRISLRVSALDGRVTLTLPRRISDAEALEFAKEKESWLRRHLGKHTAPCDVQIGGRILFEGEELAIVAGGGTRARMEGDEISVPDRPGLVGVRIKALFKTEAHERLLLATDYYAEKLGQHVHGIRLRDTRSRWGSCNSNGELMFSWRLIMAPPNVLDYVAAHEVAHLIEMNHSSAYWDIVQKICPNYKEHRNWLRMNGAQLHRYRFND